MEHPVVLRSTQSFWTQTCWVRSSSIELLCREEMCSVYGLLYHCIYIYIRYMYIHIRHHGMLLGGFGYQDYTSFPLFRQGMVVKAKFYPVSPVDRNR